MIKKFFAKICFYYMSKGLDILLRVDSDVKTMLDIITDGTTIKLAILGREENLVLKKQAGRLFVCKKDKNIDCDLAINFKYFGLLPDIVFGKIGVTDCYLKDNFYVAGNLRYAVAFVFAIEKFMAYLLCKKTYHKRYGVQANNAIGKPKMFAKLLFSRRAKK